jgi:hypothetical protein
MTAIIFLAALYLIPNQWTTTQALEIDLMNKTFVWKPFGATIVSQNASALDIVVVTYNNGSLWNRAYLPIQINSTSKDSVLLNLDYNAISYVGNATFFSEVRDNSSNKILWDNYLNITNGQSSNRIFMLPKDILNKPVEFRLYVITDGPGQHTLDVKKAVLSFSNVTQPIKVDTP